MRAASRRRVRSKNRVPTLLTKRPTTGQRLTLYVTREAPKLQGRSETGFRFGQDGPVNVFYWVDAHFGYAISGGANRDELTRVANEVYRQLAPG